MNSIPIDDPIFDLSDLPIVLPSNEELPSVDLALTPLATLSSSSSSPLVSSPQLQVDQENQQFLQDQQENKEEASFSDSSTYSSASSDEQGFDYDLLSFYRRINHEDTFNIRVFLPDDFFAFNIDLLNFLALDDRVEKIELIKIEFASSSVQFYEGFTLSEYVRNVVDLNSTKYSTEISHMICKQIILKLEDCSLKENPIPGIKYKALTPASYNFTLDQWADNIENRMKSKNLFNTSLWRCPIKFTFKVNDQKIVNFRENRFTEAMAVNGQELRTSLFTEKMVSKFYTDFHTK